MVDLLNTLYNLTGLVFVLGTIVSMGLRLTMNFGNEEVVMVVVYSLITLLVMTPLALELGKRTKISGAG